MFLRGLLSFLRATFISMIVTSALASAAAGTTLTFEGFVDGTILTNQYPGLVFSNAVILSSGLSLNEFEFPPYSGTNAVSDNNGPMSISFLSPVLNFGGYFTYTEPFTIDAYDSTNTLVATAASMFSSNDALYGDPGSSPNEYLQVSFPGGISSVVLTGDPLGGSFTLDDATYSSVPEPSSTALLAAGMALVACSRKRFANQKPSFL